MALALRVDLIGQRAGWSANWRARSRAGSALATAGAWVLAVMAAKTRSAIAGIPWLGALSEAMMSVMDFPLQIARAFLALSNPQSAKHLP